MDTYLFLIFLYDYFFYSYTVPMFITYATCTRLMMSDIINYRRVQVSSSGVYNSVQIASGRISYVKPVFVFNLASHNVISSDRVSYV